MHAYIDIYIYIYKVQENPRKQVLSFKPLKSHGFKNFPHFKILDQIGTTHTHTKLLISRNLYFFKV